MAFQLRDYQRECVGIIDALEGGSHLVHMATGLGKTVTFASIRRRGRVLVLSHRDELVRQPVKYFDCPVGIEQASESSHGEDVVSATVQTLGRARRLEKFRPGDFDTVITDEAHHALAPSYRKIVDYLQPRLHVGFTATPRRGDDRGLEDVFEDIVFSRDLKWGIMHGWLADIDARRVYVDWNTKVIHKVRGDFNNHDLEFEVNKPHTNEQIAAAYQEFAEGQTLVFATSVKHAYALSELIPRSAVVDGKMAKEDRAAVLEAFRSGEIECLLNYGVFTEGTDLPMIQTVLLARPTQNPSLYAQMVGRGLRLDPEHGKTSVRLIDCVGVTQDQRLCTAPTLFGLNEKDFPEGSEKALNGPISTLEERMAGLEDSIQGWVLRARRVDLLNDRIAWMRFLDGSSVVSGDGFMVRKSAPDDLGGVLVEFRGKQTSARYFKTEEDADSRVYRWLRENPLTNGTGARSLWDPMMVARWGELEPTEAQMLFICGHADTIGGVELIPGDMNRREAAIAISTIKSREGEENARKLGRCPYCGAPLKLGKTHKLVSCSNMKYKTTPEGDFIPYGCTFRFYRNFGGYRLTDADIRAAVTGDVIMTYTGAMVALVHVGEGADLEHRLIELYKIKPGTSLGELMKLAAVGAESGH